MTAPLAPTDEFLDLMCDLVEKRISPQQIDRLDALLCADPASSQDYVDFMLIAKGLRWIGVSQTAECDGEIDEERIPGSMAEQVISSGPQLHRSQPLTAAPRIESSGVGPATTPHSLLGHTIHGTLGYFASGWPTAYVVATIVFAIGLLIGGLVHVSHPVPVAQQSPSLKKAQPSGDLKLDFVGRITGMIGCKWADPTSDAIKGDYVPLGGKYAPASGLMEITYDTGAKVVLQGPVTYEVESPNGGFISLGKLTARLEKRGEGREESGEKSPNLQISKSPNPSLSTNHYPLFTVRTPTATVTDLGTEFGVEVRDSGTTSAHVFRGVVEMHVIARDSQRGQAIRLCENESARVEQGHAGAAPTIHRTVAEPVVFVRPAQLAKLTEEQKPECLRRWQACSERVRRDPTLVAYYDFQRKADSPRILHSVANGADGTTDGMIEQAEWAAGRMPGKQALRFHGGDSNVRVYLPRKMTQMTVAAWVAIDLIDKAYSSCALLMSDGWKEPPGKCHWQITGDGRICFGTEAAGGTVTDLILPEREWGKDRWRHLAVVADPAHHQAMCYLDGARCFTIGIAEDYFVTFGSAEIGNWWSTNNRNERGFVGRMDELMIFARAMTDQEIADLYQAGKR